MEPTLIIKKQIFNKTIYQKLYLDTKQNIKRTKQTIQTKHPVKLLDGKKRREKKENMNEMQNNIYINIYTNSWLNNV